MESMFSSQKRPGQNRDDDKKRARKREAATDAGARDEEHGLDEEEQGFDEASEDDRELDAVDFLRSSMDAQELRARHEASAETPTNLVETESKVEEPQDDDRRRRRSSRSARRVPDIQPTINDLVTRSTRHEIPHQDDRVAQELSRLAFLIDSVTSGGTCTAVLELGQTLVVSQNASGKAAAMNTGFLFGTLEQVGSNDNALTEPMNRHPTEREVFYGGEPVDQHARDEGSQSKSHRSAKDLAREQRLLELAFTDQAKRRELEEQATADADRRLAKAARYLQGSDIARIVIHQGATEGVHAEMRLLDGLHDFLEAGGSLEGVPIKLGISKLCCALCYLGVELFKRLHPRVELKVQGTHGNLYGRWPLPRFVTAHVEQFANLLGELRRDPTLAPLCSGEQLEEPLRGAVLRAIPVAERVDQGAKGKGKGERKAKAKGKGKGRETSAETPARTTTEYWSDGEQSSDDL